MSEQNLEIVRRANELTNDGDMTAARQFSHADIEWVIAKEHPDSRTLVGHEAVLEYQQEWQEMLPNTRVVFARVLDAGDKVVALGTVRGRGLESGADVEVPIGFVFTLREGLIARVEEYLDPGDALRAAGLEE